VFVLSDELISSCYVFFCSCVVRVRSAVVGDREHAVSDLCGSDLCPPQITSSVFMVITRQGASVSVQAGSSSNSSSSR